MTNENFARGICALSPSTNAAKPFISRRNRPHRPTVAGQHPIRRKRQLAEPAEDVVEVASLLLDMESLDPGGKGKKDGVHFELRQMLPNAHVRSPTKRNVLGRTARHIKPVRIWRG